jgi:purine-binding chemotaxis protein CheW
MIQPAMLDADDLNAFCTFSVGDVMCGVPVGDIREIVSDLPVTPVPSSAVAISGLINLRGQILTVVDMMEWLRRDRSEASEPARFHLIVSVANELISLRVGEMGPVISPQESDFEPVPRHMDRVVSERLQSVVKLSDRLVLMLRVEKLIELKNTASAKSLLVEGEPIGSRSLDPVDQQVEQDIQ